MLDYVELFGSDISPESRRHSLSVAYVSLNLAAEDGAGAHSVSTEGLLDRLKPGECRMMIRGAAGSGKSTLFRWATLASAGSPRSETGSIMVEGLSRRPRRGRKLFGGDFGDIVGFGSGSPARAVIHEPLESVSPPSARTLAWHHRIPFLVRLRDCKQGELPSPDDFPKLISKHLGEPPTDWVRTVLKDGRGLVLLDGVDEVPGEFRDVALFEQIKDIVEAYPKTFFLVSTRPEAVEENWLASLGFREARINPMSDLDKGQFIENWHKAVAAERRRKGSSDEGLESLAQKLKANLPENPSVNQLASWPLLCAMICALHERTDGELPENQRQLCERLCFMLLDERERKIGLDDTYVEAYRRLTYDQKKAIVQELALHMIDRKRESSLEYDDARDQVARRLDNTPGQAAKSADDVLTTLIARSGMLRQSKPPGQGTSGRIEFIHNTFKEYLAGIRLAHEDADGKLAAEADDEVWQRVIVFAASAEIPGFATKLVEKIIGRRSTVTKLLPMMGKGGKKATDAQRKAAVSLLLALRCRGVAWELDADLDIWLHERAKLLTPPSTMTAAEALAAAGEAAVPFLRHKKSFNQKQAAASVRALQLIGTKAAEAKLREYFGREELPVLEELAQAVNPLEIPAVQSMVQRTDTPYDERKKYQRIRRQINDLTPLSGLSQLQTLILADTQVSDVNALSGLSQLQTLHLIGTPVSDVSALSGLSQLQTLNLIGTPVSDVSALSSLSQLQTLNLIGTPVSDVSALSSLSQLQTLHLSETQVSDVSALSSLSQLQSLHLDLTEVSDVSALSGLSQLQTLTLNGTQVSDVSALSGLSQLQTLYLLGTQVSDVSALSGLSQLQRLYLSKGAKMTVPESLKGGVIWI